MEPVEDQSNLKDDLLAAAHPVEVEEEGPPKRNTKQALIDKIIEVSQKEGIPLEHSNTSLKRMNKQKLSNLLAEIIETGVRQKMARQVGCDKDADNRTIALGALRMLHDVCAVGCEKVGNGFLEPRGYEISGFSEALKEPTVSSCIDGCLREIAEENQELLEYVQSPYTRLMIAWGGAIAFSCKKTKIEHATHLGRGTTGRQNPVRRRVRRGSPPREVNTLPPLAPKAVKTV